MVEPQVCGAIHVSGKRHATVLDAIGAALLIIKHQRDLTLVQMGEDIRKSDDTIARYIAGEKEMGVVTWLRAIEAYPELPSLVSESAAEREARASQLDLGVDAPARKRAA
jgi:hypothetical protein